MDFEIISEIADIETFAVGLGVRDRKKLWKLYGKGRWRKRKGIAQVRLPSDIPKSKWFAKKRQE